MPVNDGRVVPTFVWRAIHDQDLFVYGNALRSFLHVDDAICAMLRLMSGDYKGAVVEVYHPRYVRMVDLARIIIDLAKSKSKVIAVHAEDRDQVHPVPPFNTPTIDLEASLSEIIRRYRDEESAVHAGNEGMAAGNHGTDVSAAETVRQKDGCGVSCDRGEAVS
jgi:nucleoside-diphosphate-sugar epimerase